MEYVGAYLFIGTVLFLVFSLIYVLLRSARRYAQVRGDPLLTLRRLIALHKQMAALRRRIEVSQQRAQQGEQRLKSHSPETPKDPHA